MKDRIARILAEIQYAEAHLDDREMTLIAFASCRYLIKDMQDYLPKEMK